MKKINIAELLKDCPKGMELDCLMYGNVTLIKVKNLNDKYPIIIKTKSGYLTNLTKYGQDINIEEAKCVIFPKGKTTWKGFVPPCKFKDGDVIFTHTNALKCDLSWVSIFQVLKWLREEKNLFVQIMFIDKYSYYYEVIDIVTAKVKCSSGDYKDSPELAAIAGIEYIIDNNLI
jgi:hypothetical protein